MFEFYSKKTKLLKKHNIIEICKLKNEVWKYGHNSNINWFNSNVKSNDIHNYIIFKKKIIGYSCLKYKKINYKKHFFVDTVIISKKYQNNNLGIMLMFFNNQVIKKYKYFGILTCQKKFYKFYHKSGWKRVDLSKKNINFYKKNIDIKSNMYLLTYS